MTDRNCNHLPLSIRVHHIEKAITRHFIIAYQTQALYTAVRHRIIQLFKLEKEPDFVLHFRDGDDFMVISSEQELQDFIQLFGEIKINLYISQTALSRFSTTRNDHEVSHPYITCDGCYKNVRGTRLKCIVCPDFDLCSSCFQQNKHWEHEMIAIRAPVKITNEQLHQVRELWLNPVKEEEQTTIDERHRCDADCRRRVNGYNRTTEQRDRQTEERIERTMEHLRVMGFLDTNGCLREIVTAAKGDLHKFLDRVK